MTKELKHIENIKDTQDVLLLPFPQHRSYVEDCFLPHKLFPVLLMSSHKIIYKNSKKYFENLNLKLKVLCD